MPRPKKRTRVAPKRKQGNKLHIREIKESKDGYSWSTYIVQGWKENGKWQRKKFKSKTDAEAFVAKKTVELLNDANLHSVTTRLSPDQVIEAEVAFKRLGDRYSLDQAITYFLTHFAEPDERVTIRSALNQFLDSKEQDGIRSRTLKALRSSLGYEKIGEKRKTGFKPWTRRRGIQHVHEVTTELVEKFLRSLRDREGIGKASRKTWNNYRADLHSFYEFCSDPRRRWIRENPVSAVRKFKVSRGVPETITAREALELMRFVAGYTGSSKTKPKEPGHLIRYFALALFAGIRTGEDDSEMIRLNAHPDREKLIDLNNKVIRIPPEVSKNPDLRTITIRPNLLKWLKSAPAEIFPPNHNNDIKAIRKMFGLGHDVMRHSFFSHHVAAFGSIGEAALEGGNSEAMVRKHYLNQANRQEGQAFWQILPEKRSTIIHIG